VLRQLLERRDLALARDFGQATGATYDPETSSELAAEREVVAVDTIMRAALSTLGS
jgi:hypothetical protein